MSPGPIQLDQATALTLMLGPNGSVGIQASELRVRKIIVADAESWNLPQHLRVSYGREEENQAFFRELKAIL